MPERISELLRTIAAGGGELNLLSVYKGLSVSNPAKILEVGPSWMRVRIDKFQAVSLFTDKFCFLQSRLLPEILRAEALKLNLPEENALLGNFRWAANGAGERKMVRVKPKAVLESEVKDRLFARSVRAELADISREGVGIYVPREAFRAWQFAQGSQVTVRLRLPGEQGPAPRKTGSLQASAPPLDRFARRNVRFSPVDGAPLPAPEPPTARPDGTDVEINATVVNVRLEVTHGRYRVGLQIERDDPARARIAQFIAQRQSEIIREIGWMYDLLVRSAEEGN